MRACEKELSPAIINGRASARKARPTENLRLMPSRMTFTFRINSRSSLSSPKHNSQSRAPFAQEEWQSTCSRLSYIPIPAGISIFIQMISFKVLEI